MKRLYWVLLLAAGAAPESSAVADTLQDGPRRPLTPIEFLELPRLSDPLLSPDGRYVLYRRSHVSWSENKRISRYRLLDLTSGQTVSLLEPEDEAESFPRPTWDLAGKGFVATMKREDDEHRQAYYYDVEEKTLERLTDHDEDVGDIVWAPDRDGFYFASERSRTPEQRAMLEDNWQIEAYDQSEPGEIWFFDIATGNSEQLVAGDFDVRSYSVSRDGRRILYARLTPPDEDNHLRELWRYDVRSGRHSLLTDNNYRESRAKLNPKNDGFAYIATVNHKGEQYYEDNLFVRPPDSVVPVLLFPDFPMEVLDFDWDAEGDALFVVGNTGVRTNLFRYDLRTEELVEVTNGDHELEDWSYSENLDAHAFLLQTPLNPGEVYVQGNGSYERVTREYEELEQRYELPAQAALTWRGRRGVRVEGLLVYPVGYSAERTFPLVTITHGGPRQSSQFGSWNISRYVPVLAGEGYGVFLPNHRGSTGYGDDFMRDMVGNYFRHAHLDVLDGVDMLVDEGLADPGKLVKMGWSAGGHMTNKLITVTDRFKAASSGAGASDWVSQYAESDTRHNRTPWFGGAPWERNAPLRNYQKQSVLKDTWRVTTPTLFFVGSRDVRVPPTQSIMMYRGVKAAGAETELYVAPDEPHNYRKPSHQLFKINTELAWFEKHVFGTDFVPQLPPQIADGARTAPTAPHPGSAPNTDR